MKRIAFILLVFFTSKIVSVQYKPIDEGSELKFTIRNFGFDVAGSFTGLQGNIYFDPRSPNNMSFDVTIDAGTVNTGNTLRDEHLKNEGYFDVKNYPRIRIVSDKIKAGNKMGYILTSKLTIKGVSKEVSFPFTVVPSGDGYIFKGTFKINRKDFGIGGSSTISDELEVSLSVLVQKNSLENK
jgi:polyisoprenoid-binding protein YceI